MPRNGSGVMSIPNTLVDQTTITAGAHNTNYTDIASEISNSVAVDGQSQMSGQFKAASGTVGSPGVTFGSDLDSGLYRIGGDNLGVSCAGAKVLDIGTAGFGVTGTLSATGAITENGAAVYKAGGTDVAVADGGTGASTATAGFDALSPVTTRGDLIKRGASNNERLAIGAANRVLRSDGTDPSWGQVVNADITDATIAHAKLASGVTATQANMESASATDTFVTPGRQKFHPLMPKASGRGASAGGIVGTAIGVTSIVRNSTGNYSVTLSTAMADTNYWVLATSMPTGGGNQRACHIVIVSTTVFTVHSKQGEAGDQDSDFAFAVFGDLP